MKTSATLLSLSCSLSLLIPAMPATAGEWVNISDPVTSKLKPGYGGPTSGVTVDPATGDVFMVVCDLGLWKSSDKGATFARVDEKTIGGRCETGWALNVDPKGSRMFCFMIYGDSAMTADGGKTWTKSKVSHLDFGGVDWEDTGKRLLGLRHESGGMLTTSDDGGASWKDLEKGFKDCGVFTSKIFVATKAKEKGIFRSEDAGATWKKISDVQPVASTPIVRNGVGYWCAGTEILVSKDKGATWAPLPGAGKIDSVYGPYFGADDKHMVVVGKEGFQESKDGGLTWVQAAPLPPGAKLGRIGPLYVWDNFAWDARNNIFYVSQMTKPTFKYQR